MPDPYPDKPGIYVSDTEAVFVAVLGSDDRWWLWRWWSGTMADYKSWYLYQSGRGDNLLTADWRRVSYREFQDWREQTTGQ